MQNIGRSRETREGISPSRVSFPRATVPRSSRISGSGESSDLQGLTLLVERTKERTTKQWSCRLSGSSDNRARKRCRPTFFIHSMHTNFFFIENNNMTQGFSTLFRVLAHLCGILGPQTGTFRSPFIVFTSVHSHHSGQFNNKNILKVLFC